MQDQRIRVSAEILTVIILIFFAWVALRPEQRKEEHYTLDKDRIIYDGQVFKNKFSGQGKLKLKNGDRYHGHFKDGRFDGRGTFVSNDGWMFKGNFSKGQVAGQGKLTTDKKKVYQGEFTNGNFKEAEKVKN